ncbi:DUF4157 domain-containing protein [Streptomyces longisporoflavus]|uniref:DUF4157 domain-containing protein n=1 Tax=Streptomyces longisporoflavus TaxID=28044 RepID=A0ABW7QFX6_9ACTN
MSSYAPSVVRRCGGHTCPPQGCDRDKVRRSGGAGAAPPVPAGVHQVLGQPGRPLRPAVRREMERGFGAGFGSVRVHTGPLAAATARELDADAYTVGEHVVFGAGGYRPQEPAGARVLAHELTHVLQQRGSGGGGGRAQAMRVGHPADPEERAADASAEQVVRRFSAGMAGAEFGGGESGGGGASGSWDDLSVKSAEGPAAAGVAPRQAPTMGPVTGSGGVRVCARALQIGPFGNHAYIDAPPFNYAIISPMCPQNTFDNPLTGTSGQKWDNSPDPCGKTPTCLTCEPKPGVTSVPECMAATFRAYNNPSLYKLSGPNSNTFAGTLARACCAGMDPKPKALGTCIGWDAAPAPYRGGKKDCPPGPTC